MSRFDRTIKSLSGTIKNSNQRKPKPFDASAEVLRIDGDIAWVHIPGGVDETPVRLTVNAKVGDIVQIRVGGSRAWITGNATAPPTDDTAAKEAKNSIRLINKTVKVINSAVDKVTRIAGNTAQYFWHTETGTDTGVHITEIPKDEFLEDPANGGGNLLARSNGIAVRDGLTELASFDGDGIEFNNDSGTQVFEVLTTQDQSIIEKGIVNINLSSSARSGSYERYLNYTADTIQYVQVWYRYKAGSSGGISYYTLTPASSSASGNHGSAQYTKAGRLISLAVTHDGTANATLSIYEIRIKYSTSVDGLSKIRSGIYPKKSDFNILEVGNGTSTSNRKNAFDVDFFGNTSPSMDFAVLWAENQTVSGAANDPVKISRAISNGDCFEVKFAIDGYTQIEVKKNGYYQILVSCLWSAVDALGVKAVLACDETGGQYNFSYAIGRDNSWERRTGVDIVYIDTETRNRIAMWARDEGGTSTLRVGQIIVRPVWLD